MSATNGASTGGNQFFRPNANADRVVKKTTKDMEAAFETTLSLGQLSLGTNDEGLPQRPNFGKEGRVTTVWANYVEMELNPEQTMRKFDISVEPKAVGRKLHRVIQLLLQQPFLRRIPHFTDFKSTLVVRMNEQPPASSRINVPYLSEDEHGPDPGQPALYHVTLRQTNVLLVGEFLQSLDPRNAFPYNHKEVMLQTLNIMLYHHSRSSHNVVAVGNKTFPLDGPASRTIDLGGGLQAMRGFFASVRAATGRVLVNVNVTYGLFYEPCSLAVLIARFGSHDKYKLERFLRHLRVKKIHLSKVDPSGKRVGPIRTIFGLASLGDGLGLGRSPAEGAKAPQIKMPESGRGPNAREVRFWMEERKQFISVYDFFTSVKGTRLASPELPVINVGSKERPVYVPPELCEVLSGQNAPMRRVKLSKMQTMRMLNEAVKKPAENFRLISDHGIQAVGLSSSSLMDPAYVKVLPNLLPVDARILDGPRIGYRQSIPRGSSWNLKNHKLNRPGRARSWSWLLISVHGHESRLEKSSFQHAMAEFKKVVGPSVTGVNLDGFLEGKRIQLCDQKDKRLGSILELAAQKVDLLWVIVPEQVDLLYDRVKQIADVRLGLATFVSVDAKLRNINGLSQYLGNEALKINLKLGGTNQVAVMEYLYFVQAGNTMLVGIDITHPSTDPGKDSAPSVAAMVASIDRSLAQWPAVLSIQRRRQEMVSDLKEMLKSRLQMWRANNNGSYPRNIVVYRDGVSEGQYQMVKDQELPLLQDACRDIYSQAHAELPRIAIIIVAKRHHTRFAPTGSGDADSTSNCRAGLVVDRTITEACTWNFFLQPHSTIKGTARPGLYTVVHDEVFRAAATGATKRPDGKALSAADICQGLTQTLCYLFGRATRAVGIATPAYYADIACDRAACYLRALNASVASSQTGFSHASSETAEITQARRDELQKAIETHPKLKGTMFYI